MNSDEFKAGRLVGLLEALAEVNRIAANTAAPRDEVVSRAFHAGQDITHKIVADHLARLARQVEL